MSRPLTAMYCVTPEKRGPGEDQYKYVAEGLLWCPWCGDCFCYDNGSRKEGPYKTSEGDRVEYPPVPSETDAVAYHPDCYREKQCERHKALNQRLTYFGGGDDAGK
jgi:hypothetical protein